MGGGYVFFYVLVWVFEALLNVCEWMSIKKLPEYVPIIPSVTHCSHSWNNDPTYSLLIMQYLR